MENNNQIIKDTANFDIRRVTRKLSYVYIPIALIFGVTYFSSFLRFAPILIMLVIFSIAMFILAAIDIPKRPRSFLSFFVYFLSIYIFWAISYMTMLILNYNYQTGLIFMISVIYGIIFMIVPFRNTKF